MLHCIFCDPFATKSPRYRTCRRIFTASSWQLAAPRAGSIPACLRTTPDRLDTAPSNLRNALRSKCSKYLPTNTRK